MIELVEEEKSQAQGATLKVFGIGGAGCNAVNCMIVGSDLQSVEFVVANTDIQSLDLSAAEEKIRLGVKITKGLGAGSNPELGRRAAEEDLENIMEHLEGADILFLTAGLGGGTGTGALPVIAQAAREVGVLTVAIVTKPFLFEGKRRARYAQEAIKHLKTVVDTLIVVPNQRLLEISDVGTSMLDAFALSNDILKQAVKGISDVITKAGHINVDFADVKSIMKEMGMAIMGTGRASGEDRARKAALSAISSPLLEDASIAGARGVLINITGSDSLGLYEINDAAMLIYDMVREDANIILGSVIDNSVGDEIVITVIATGFDEHKTESKAIPAALDREENEQAMIKQQVEAHKKHHEEKHHHEVSPAAHKAPEHDDYSEQQASHEQGDVTPSSLDQLDENDLDAPTFLRKHAKLGEKQGE